MHDAYPKGRPAFFAMKFIRTLSKVCAAQEIGSEAFALLVIIATTEDAAGYRRAVTWYDEQLIPLLGISSRRQLARIRDKARKHGWLHYDAGKKRVPGKYWVTIPDHAIGLDDAPSDEGEIYLDTEHGHKCHTNGDETVQQSCRNGDETVAKRCQTGDETVHSLPIPVPVPTPKEDFAPQAFDRKVLDPINFDPWLQAFLAMWDATPGVVKQGCQVSEMERREIEKRLADPWWEKNWRRALEMFPLPWFQSQGNLVGLLSFLEDGFVQKVCQRKYHNKWSKPSSKRESKVDEIVDVISQVQELEDRRNTAFQTSATGRLT